MSTAMSSSAGMPDDMESTVRLSVLTSLVSVRRGTTYRDYGDNLPISTQARPEQYQGAYLSPPLGLIMNHNQDEDVNILRHGSMSQRASPRCSGARCSGDSGRGCSDAAWAAWTTSASRMATDARKSGRSKGLLC